MCRKKNLVEFCPCPYWKRLPLKPQVRRNLVLVPVAAVKVVDTTPIDNPDRQATQFLEFKLARLTQDMLNIDQALFNATEQPNTAQVQRAREEQRQ